MIGVIGEKCGIVVRQRHRVLMVFPFRFLKRCWDLVANDIAALVSYFHGNPFILKGCNVSFFAIIPKT